MQFVVRSLRFFPFTTTGTDWERAMKSSDWD
jgi:hypothetical protein